MNTTYSFQDCNTVIRHPSVGQHSINGDGIGSITFTQTAEQAVKEVAADGAVVTSKIKNYTGTVAIQMQQTSPLNKFLLRMYNYLKTAPASEFNLGSLLCAHKSTGEQQVCKGLVPSKMPDKPYGAQQQMVTWTLMCDSIQTNNI